RQGARRDAELLDSALAADFTILRQRIQIAVVGGKQLVLGINELEAIVSLVDFDLENATGKRSDALSYLQRQRNEALKFTFFVDRYVSQNASVKAQGCLPICKERAVDTDRKRWRTILHHHRLRAKETPSPSYLLVGLDEK